MSIVTFSELPDSSRLWIFGAARELPADQVQSLHDHMQNFLTEWTAHKQEMNTAWELKYNRFVMVAVDESTMGASGCSIDAMVRNLHAYEEAAKIRITSTNAMVFFRDPQEQIQCVSRLDFKQLVGESVVSAETTVFDNTIQTTDELRRGRWELPMKASWHMDAFPVVV